MMFGPFLIIGAMIVLGYILRPDGPYPSDDYTDPRDSESESESPENGERNQ
jgi:hypothetical protein